MTNKPTSKVIQILEDLAGLITTLCEDGSIWTQYNKEKWICILEAYKEPDHIVDANKKVQEALDQVKRRLNCAFNSYEEEVGELEEVVKNLVNALESKI